MKKHLQTLTRSLDIPAILFGAAFLLILGIAGESDYQDAVKTCLQTVNCKVQ